VEIRCRVGYLSGELALHENLTGRELLDYVANLRGLPDRWLAGASAWTSTQAATSMTCPRGNRQKLGLVQALKRHPRAAAPGRADQRA
jgi:beta-exotoxin I transport system ATP-binding protein